jgi:hypothetical protein
VARAEGAEANRVRGELLGGDVGLSAEMTPDRWIRCEKCEKWRRRRWSEEEEEGEEMEESEEEEEETKKAEEESKNDPRRGWTCGDCDWHAGIARDGCSAPQEPWDELPLWDRAPCRAKILREWDRWVLKTTATTLPPREEEEKKKKKKMREDERRDANDARRPDEKPECAAREGKPEPPAEPTAFARASEGTERIFGPSSAYFAAAAAAARDDACGFVGRISAATPAVPPPPAAAADHAGLATPFGSAFGLTFGLAFDAPIGATFASGFPRADPAAAARFLESRRRDAGGADAGAAARAGPRTADAGVKAEEEESPSWGPKTLCG